MKIRRILVFVMLFALALSSAAYADVAYAPQDNFFEENYERCQLIDRYYITNSPEGCVVAYTSPTGEAKIVVRNGVEYKISVIWSEGSINHGDDIVWGCIEYNSESLEYESTWLEGESAWVDMSLMTPRYDSESFIEEHADELSDDERWLEIGAGQEVVCYRYPGSGIVENRISSFGGDEYSTLTLGSIYTDAEGREWGHGVYYYGYRDFWVCISDPFTELPAGAEYREPEIIPAADEAAMEKALGDAGSLSDYTLALAVGIVIIAAAVIAYIIIRKRKGV